MKVKNFSGFMRSKLNESMGSEYADDNIGMGMYGANPEDEDALADEEGADTEEGADEELTLEDLKAMIDELTERVEALESGGEEEEGAEEEEEGAEEEGAEEEGAEEEGANESWRFKNARRYRRY